MVPKIEVIAFKTPSLLINIYVVKKRLKEKIYTIFINMSCTLNPTHFFISLIETLQKMAILCLINLPVSTLNSKNALWKPAHWDWV